MPGEHSGGMIGQIGSAPAPKPKSSGPGGKTHHSTKRGQTKAPTRKKSVGTVSGGQNGQRAGRSQPKSKRAPMGGGGGFNGSGEVGAGFTSSSLGAVSTPAAPDINSFLTGDSTYQSQVAALAKALQNYKTQMGETQTEYGADFTNRLRDLGTTEQRSTTDQADDYAGRGMYISGLYGKARGDLEQDFDNREGDMNLAKQTYMSGLNRDLLNFTEDNNLSQQKAKQDALQRRSLQYGL